MVATTLVVSDDSPIVLVGVILLIGASVRSFLPARYAWQRTEKLRDRRSSHARLRIDKAVSFTTLCLCVPYAALLVGGENAVTMTIGGLGALGFCVGLIGIVTTLVFAWPSRLLPSDLRDEPSLWRRKKLTRRRKTT